MEHGFETQYQEFIHKSRYARYNDSDQRRENWYSTVNRYIGFFANREYPSGRLSRKDRDILSQAIRKSTLGLEVMPSMRSLMTAGPALERDNVAGYNCSYLAINRVRAFDELMYILLCGTGVGFSVERQYINQLPEVAEEFNETETVIRVADSKVGWAKAFKQLIAMLYAGEIPQWDTSKIRPAGARLKTFGGRASGPEPLEDLFKFAIEVFKGAAGRKLNSLEVHDVVCKIADVVVVGGVRRSALISLSNLTDERMRNAKSGQWWENNPQRALANNSVCYTERPDIGIFMKEWESLYESKSGERGIFYRGAAQRAVGKSGRRDTEYDFGTNPCSEIILRDRQFCNLSEVVVRPGDTLDQLKEKVRAASILGTLQSTLTDFRYLSKTWKDNCEEERLLGVSLTGIMDHPVLSGCKGPKKKDGFPHGKTLEKLLKELKEVCIETNKEWAAKLGINQSTAITCVKPSGTVSQLVDSASGIHPRYSDYYIRTVRADKKDPLAEFMVQQGFPVEPDVTKPDTTLVFSFPVKSPKGSVLRDDLTAIDQLEIWKVYAEHWCEHKPSITVYVREHEWLDVGAWIYRNFDICSGISFLPHTDHSYRQAPYQEITEEAYTAAMAAMPKGVNFDELTESEDSTTGQQELACTGGACEL